MQEVYSYTQRPEEDRMFTVTDICKMVGASPCVIRSLAENAGIESFLSKERKNVIVFNFKGMKQIVALYKNVIGIDEVKKNNKVQEPKTIEELRTEHPLVKDDRFFKLSFFPDIVPKCFTEEI